MPKSTGALRRSWLEASDPHAVPVKARAMSIDSSPVFQLRVKSCKLGDLWDAFVANGWSTIAEFAFSANYTPGSQDDTPFLDEIVQPLTGDRASPRKAAIRRLHFECVSRAAKELADRSNRTEKDEKSKKLPGVEREARLANLRKKLSDAIDIEGETEPSGMLCDKTYSMSESGEVKYIKWEECTSREAEVEGVKIETCWKPNAEGLMAQSQTASMDPADTSSEQKLTNALIRRGVSYDIVGIMSFKTHQGIIKFLMDARNAKPLPGHLRVSLEQLRNADIEIFAKAVRATATGLDLGNDGNPILDTLIPEILKGHKVNQLLAQLQGNSKDKIPKRDASKAELDKLRQENQRLKAKVSKGEGKARGKGKGGGKNGRDRYTNVPQSLIGLNTTLDGKRLCFAYNLGSCMRGVDKCDKGLHNCMKCGAKHPAVGPDGRCTAE